MIIDQVGDNKFQLDMPPYMQIYSIVNVENLKLYEPTLVVQDTCIMLPIYEYLALEHMSIFSKDAVLEKKISSSNGDHVMWHIRLKGKHPHKAKWYAID